jgi:hypothetical protein
MTKGDMISVITIEKLYMAEESVDPQSSVRQYILEEMKLYSKVIVCEETREIFEIV